jgi:hypothetical protein
VTDVLRKLLALRESLTELSGLIGLYGYRDEAPEIAKMQELERELFAKVNEWDKP